MAPNARAALWIGLATLIAGCGKSSTPPGKRRMPVASTNMERMVDSKPDSPVHTIVMPHDEPVFPAGLVVRNL